MKLSACIEWLFADETDDIAERVRLAARAGLQGVEFHLWRNKPLAAIERALHDTGLDLSGIVVEPRRSLVNPEQHEEFLQAVRESLPVARQLGCDSLVVASGFEEAGITREQQRDNMVGVLRIAAAMATDAGATLILEPLNSKIDHPGMYLCSTTLGLDIVEQVDSPGLGLLYDAYHSSVMGESIDAVLGGRLPLVRHVQIADNPGRGAPGTGTIDWGAVLTVLRGGGYEGMLGLEFKLNGQSTRAALESTRAALASR